MQLGPASKLILGNLPQSKFPPGRIVRGIEKTIEDGLKIPIGLVFERWSGTLIRFEELVSRIRPVHLGQVAPTMGNIYAGRTDTGIDSIDYPADLAILPEYVGRMVIAMNEGV